MSYQNDRFGFEPANPADSAELLDILEQDEFKGQISLLYTRRPDAFASLGQEGEEVFPLVCRDRHKGLIIGFGACAIRELYVNGRPEPTAYLFGLRSRKQYRRIFPLLPRGYAAMGTWLKERGVSLVLTSILEDNTYARDLLEKSRSFMPGYHPLGAYTVYILKHFRRESHPYRCARAGDGDIENLTAFLNAQGKGQQFFPVIRAADLRHGRMAGLKPGDFLIMFNAAGEILAAGAAWNQRGYKQYIMKGYEGWLKNVQPLSGIFPRFGYPALPAPGTVLDFVTLSFWAVRHNDPDLFRFLLGEFSAAVREHIFFAVGLHETNPLNEVLRRAPHIGYRSRIYRVVWEKDRDKTAGLELGGGIYLECGAL